MKLQIFFYACIVFVSFIGINVAEESDGAASVKFIKDNLAEFIAIKDIFAKRNINATLQFTRTEKDEENAIKHKHKFAFGSINWKETDEFKPVEDLSDKAKYVFIVADKLNISSILSKEKYAEDGSIILSQIYVENAEINYQDGVSTMLYEGKGGDEDMSEEEVEQFVDMLREYELPVEVHKTVYNEAGNVIKDITNKYTPKRVKLLDGDMPFAMQLEVAEALKQSSVTKDKSKDRINLVTKYLKVLHSEYTWGALVGGGPHFIKKDIEVDLELDGEVYKFWGVE